MGTITVTLADDAEEWLRKNAGRGKGKLGGKLTELLRRARDSDKRDRAGEKIIEFMKKAKPIGVRPVSREELHER